MATLRVAFLSGAVLEFITTLSVAIVAVEVGFRLLYGRLDLATALLVIMIAPEVYQPCVRSVSTSMPQLMAWPPPSRLLKSLNAPITKAAKQPRS